MKKNFDESGFDELVLHLREWRSTATFLNFGMSPPPREVRFDIDDGAEPHGEEIQDCTPENDHARHGDIEMQMCEAHCLQGAERERERLFMKRRGETSAGTAD